MASDQPLNHQNLIKKLSKLSWLLLSKYYDIDNFLVMQYITETVVLLSPSIIHMSCKDYMWVGQGTWQCFEIFHPP